MSFKYSKESLLHAQEYPSSTQVRFEIPAETFEKRMVKMTVLSGRFDPGHVYQPKVITPGTLMFDANEPGSTVSLVTAVAITIEGS